jgi:uncharacterized protein (DUF433 family)
MYSEAEAARYLRVAQSTLNYRLEGGQRRGKVYSPVIRAEPRGRRAPVTWAEFVEVGLLHSYRRKGIPIDPDLRGGRPAVAGISTSVIREHDEAGEDGEDIATSFDLTVDQVRRALAFETSLPAA